MHLATNDFILSFRISIAGTVISLFLLASILQPLGLIQGEAIAQQQSQQEPGQKISVGAAQVIILQIIQTQHMDLVCSILLNGSMRKSIQVSI